MADHAGLPDAFFALLRKSTKAGVWSQGVSLSRDGQVVVESRDADEIVLRVKAPGRPVAPTVVLYPGEREWDCDCGGRMNPCEHVAAAAIALTAGETESASSGPPPAAEVWGRLVYRLARAGEGLRLERFIASGAQGQVQEQPLVGTLTSLLSKPALAGKVQPEQHDLKADLLLGTGGRGVLPPSKLDALIQVLIDARNVRLDGVPVGMSDEMLLPRAAVRDVDGPDGEIEVRLERDPRVIEVPSPGVGLTADGILARLGETAETGFWLEHLPRVTRYRASQVGELTARILPDLSARMAVDVRSRRLPKVVRDLEPRILLELQHLGDRLTVLPTLVYGAPPCVRIDDGRMVYLKGPVPVRDRDAEKREIHRLRERLDLLPGHRVTFEGRDVGAFASKLRRWRGALTGDAADLVGSKLRLVPQMSVTGADGNGNGGRRARVALRPALRGHRRGQRRRPVRGCRGGDPCLARRAGLRAPGRRRLGAAATRLAGQARPAGGRSAGGARERRAGGQPRPAGAGCSVRRAGSPSPARTGTVAAPGARVRAAARGGAAGGSQRHPAPLPATGRRLAGASCARPAWAVSWPTTWAWARPSRRWRSCARGRARWWCAQPACCPTGRTSLPASGPA